MIKNTRVFFVLSVFFFKAFIKGQSLFLVSLIFLCLEKACELSFKSVNTGAFNFKKA